MTSARYNGRLANLLVQAGGRPLPKQFGHNGKSRGFTLIELMVVIVIIGLILSFGVLSIHSNEDKQVETEARRFAALVKLAGEESVMRAQELAVQLQRDGYTFLELSGTGWVPVEDDERVFRPRELPKDITISGELNGEPVPFEATVEGQEPRIFVFSSGEMTPFEVEFKRDFSTAAFQVAGDFAGKVTYAGRTTP